MMIYLLFCSLFFSLSFHAQSPYDVQHYQLGVRILEGSQIVFIDESITIQLNEPMPQLVLDLAGPLANGSGMKVISVTAPNQKLTWQQTLTSLQIDLPSNLQNGALNLGIKLEGKPADGLIIDANKYGDTTYFADNWPNRAHFWYACHDHPSDKATYTFLVEAPSIYQVVANGILLSKTPKPERNAIVWNYAIDEPIPTKVAVIGVADFCTKEIVKVGQTPIIGTVYSKDSLLGLASFEVAPEILAFFEALVGPYPFKELNNVQSTTRYGGMENAGCIFYDENSLNADLRSTHLIAHEVAHQWFGNAVSEADWQHLWLSEGFATYLTNMYIETHEGKEAFLKQLASDRMRVYNLYNKGFQQALIDSLTPNLQDRLNANAYQKGAWVLHMLRHEMGDSLFKLGLQQFYKTYKYQNATSQDFAHLMDSLSPKDLAPFFNQWLYQVGHPQLKTRILTQKGKQYIEITQVQANLFAFPLQIRISPNGKPSALLHFNVSQRKEQFEIPEDLIGKDVQLMMDPNMHLLFEPVH
jgi:aminopeptidase N